jgi:Holliday junction resolvase RusA-like endonuclease
MRIDIDFPLTSKSNFRRGLGSKDWTKHKEFKDILADLAIKNRPSTWDLGPPPPAPLKHRPTVVMAIVATSVLDTANLSKSVADAFEHELYHTDASVRMVLSASTRARKNQGASILLALLSPNATYDQMRSALDELLDEVLAETPDSASPGAPLTAPPDRE